MSDDTASAATAGTRRGFVLLIHTVCDGIVPAEWDGDGHPILYATHADAEAERLDWIALRRDADSDDAAGDADDGAWIEAAIQHADGSLALVDIQHTLTCDDLRAART